MPPANPITPSSTLDHESYMRLAISEARKSPPQPTNFCVGAVLVNERTGDILATGYTLELPGNTHAEQCALQKYAEAHELPEERVGEVLPPQCAVYTTMEPCAQRLSGNLPCVDRLLRARREQDGKAVGVVKVFSGVREPETFVGENVGRKRLGDGGVECILVSGFEEEILGVATAGHVKE
ncbi:uncharacterized protein K452DRAFT_327129 [Aplosporella prunicola CBS 121167]|uniref:CMP/dCMP-type deaminase domain-containing protein n=1 Tax=Aplosporella prunicola CBS 121167 TaxID=1176127 RepID=A0A6A6BBP1_9PEZI|nr:uncharacterized protein K452DRAFT_327129 [Aplosporella prunicola CBS 121167]KAF2141466.1 hypothetical protein K452DRAFT_327129 [Aplosporella prunicola CBS 121167]